MTMFKRIFIPIQLFNRSARSVSRTRKVITFGTVTVATMMTFSSASCDSDTSNDSDTGDKPTIPDAINTALHTITDAITPNRNSPNDNGDFIERLIEQFSGQINELGMSGLLGVCSAMALKKLGRNAAAMVGTVFVVFQALQRLGYIDINMHKVTKDVTALIDVNGDGKLDEKDLVLLWRRLRNMLEQNVPSVGSFGAGFMIGFYVG